MEAKKEAHAGKRVLLPTHLLPKHYLIHLDVEPEASFYSGTVLIDLVVQKTSPSNSVTLHARGLEFDKTKILLKRFSPDGVTVASELTTDSFSTNEDDDTVTFTFGGQPFHLTEKLALSLTFSNHIESDCAGLYHSNYLLNGELKYVLSSNCPSTCTWNCLKSLFLDASLFRAQRSLLPPLLVPFTQICGYSRKSITNFVLVCVVMQKGYRYDVRVGGCAFCLPLLR